MKRLSYWALLALILMAGQALTRPITSYQYLTELETTNLGEIIWFWTPDTVWGPLHSNDFIGIKYSPTFFGPVSTCKNNFHYYQRGNVHFEQEPVFNAPEVNLPHDLTFQEDHASVRFNDDGGRLMTWMKLHGDAGIDVFQYELGLERHDTNLVRHLSPPIGDIIWVDGKLELEGLFRGWATIAASDDIYLLDDVRYADSDEHGAFDQESCRDLLGVASAGNIIIANTEANGKDNGYAVGRDRLDRHSIALNGCYMATGESFTFEQQNDDWDRYQGPTPDQRGQMWLWGSLTQKRAGYLHRSNHEWTGYGRSLRYDFRLSRMAPPGFAVGELYGDMDRVELFSGSHDIYSCRIQTLIVHAGVELNLQYGNLVVTDSLVMVGSADSLVIVHDNGEGQALLVETGAVYTSLSNVAISGSGEYQFNSETTILDRVTSTSPIACEGSTTVTGSDFGALLTLTGFRTVSVTGSLFRAGLILRGSPRTCTIDRSTFASSDGTGITYRGGVEPLITNCIIAFNRIGIVRDGRFDATIRYSDVHENRVDNYLDCEPGEGCIDVNPLFVNAFDDFHLTAESPCIDIGDPGSPHDSDGTVADMGAFYFHHQLSAPGDDFGLRIAEFGVSASPNPFNDRTTLTLAIPLTGQVKIAVYDLSGRLKAELLGGKVEVGKTSLSLDASGWPAGVYLLRLQSGSEIRNVKIVKLN